MKNTILLLTAAVLLGGCTIENSYDENDIDPAYWVFQRIYEDGMEDLFRITELADFYTNYLEIKEDRPAAEKLLKEYFGDNEYELYYQAVYVYGWGTMENSSNSQNSRYTIRTYTGYNEIKTTVTVSGNGTYSLKREGDKFMTIAATRVEDGIISIDEMKVAYTDADGVEISIGTADGDTPAMPRCAYGSIHTMPLSGCIDISLSGHGVSDEFTAVFGSNGYYLMRDNQIIEKPYYL